MKNKLFISSTLILLTIPSFVFAAEGAEKLLDNLGKLVGTATPIAVGIALLAFFWGLAKFIYFSADESKREEGKKGMIWGIIALFVIMSIWGIVTFLQTSLGFSADNNLSPPCLQGLDDGCDSGGGGGGKPRY